MKIFFLSLLGAALFFTACKKDNDPDPVDTTVTITNASPVTGIYGTTVTITGKNFSTVAANNNVKINGVTATVSSATATELMVVVPPKAGTGAISVQVGSQTATGPTWTHIYQGTVSTLAGSGVTGYADGTGTTAQFSLVSYSSICVDASGNVFVGELGNNRVRKITPAGVVTTVAGSGAFGFMDGPAASAQFSGLRGITADAAGNLYLADVSNHRIRKISTGGIVSTLAGTGVSGFADGPGNTAQFNSPFSIVYNNTDGNLYVADANYRIRKITLGGDVSSIAGSGVAGFADGTGTAAQFGVVTGLIADSHGDIFFADGNNQRIRKVTTAGVVTTYAGTGVSGNTNGNITTATLSLPTGIAIDPGGNLYTVQPFNQNVRKISPVTVSTLAGKGTAGITNGPGSIAEFNEPRGLAISNDGIVYIVDSKNEVIRKIVLE